MQIVKKVLLSPLALLYIIVVKMRHWLFDSSIIKSERFTTPIVCVGNITVGGTGKSPMSEYLLSSLTPRHSVALLSRGYGRRTRGYREVSGEDSYSEVGDEPLQIKRKYPHTVVVVCEKRIEGARRIIESHPDVELIIMDDGFQHRHITPHLNIIMVDARRPISADYPLPLGSLRDTPSALRRADIFVVTKCPDSTTQGQMDAFRRELLTRPDQEILFSKIVNLSPLATYPEIAPPFDPAARVMALSGIGNPAPFVEWVAGRYSVAKEMTFADHHSYTSSEIEQLVQSLEEDGSLRIITTEKDSVKFLSNNDIPQIIKQRLYYTQLRMQFIAGEESSIIKKIEELWSKRSER